MPPLQITISRHLLNFIVESEKKFRTLFDAEIDLNRYKYRSLFIPSTVQLTPKDVAELKNIFECIPQIHKKNGISGSFRENIIAIFCYIKKDFELDKENVPPALDRFLHKISRNARPDAYLQNFNLLSFQNLPNARQQKIF